MLRLLVEAARLKMLMAWCSTLGGAHSALGEHSISHVCVHDMLCILRWYHCLFSSIVFTNVRMPRGRGNKDLQCGQMPLIPNETLTCFFYRLHRQV